MYLFADLPATQSQQTCDLFPITTTLKPSAMLSTNKCKHNLTDIVDCIQIQNQCGSAYLPTGSDDDGFTVPAWLQCSGEFLTSDLLKLHAWWRRATAGDYCASMSKCLYDTLIHITQKRNLGNLHYNKCWLPWIESEINQTKTHRIICDSG